MLPADDEARIVWQFVKESDLCAFYAQIRAVEGRAGRNSTDPKILLALWLFATLKAVGSARELDRLCQCHISYQWLCGDVSMNYHTLADFRVTHGELLDRLLTEQLAALVHSGAVTLERVAQDGMRVRASAGKASFHRRGTLEQSIAEAEEQLRALKAELEEDPATASRRAAAARQRAAKERVARVKAALEACDEVQRQKEHRGRDSLKHPARGSSTDPEARNMKMADGGFRPAFNVQFCTDTQSQVIVGVNVTNAGTDADQFGPMIEQIEERTGVRPPNILGDGGYSTKADIQKLNDPEKGYKVYAPVREDEKQLAKGQDPFAPRRGESTEVTEWRTRMGTEEAKQIYKERASTAECVNALARQRGLTHVRVRGLRKVRVIALWYAIAHNLRRWGTLRAASAEEQKNG
jgi:transposase